MQNNSERQTVQIKLLLISRVLFLLFCKSSDSNLFYNSMKCIFLGDAQSASQRGMGGRCVRYLKTPEAQTAHTQFSFPVLFAVCRILALF